MAEKKEFIRKFADSLNKRFKININPQTELSQVVSDIAANLPKSHQLSSDVAKLNKAMDLLGQDLKGFIKVSKSNDAKKKAHSIVKGCADMISGAKDINDKLVIEMGILMGNIEAVMEILEDSFQTMSSSSTKDAETAKSIHGRAIELLNKSLGGIKHAIGLSTDKITLSKFLNENEKILHYFGDMGKLQDREAFAKALKSLANTGFVINHINKIAEEFGISKAQLKKIAESSHPLEVLAEHVIENFNSLDSKVKDYYESYRLLQQAVTDRDIRTEIKRGKYERCGGNIGYELEQKDVLTVDQKKTEQQGIVMLIAFHDAISGIMSRISEIGFKIGEIINSEKIGTESLNSFKSAVNLMPRFNLKNFYQLSGAVQDNASEIFRVGFVSRLQNFIRETSLLKKENPKVKEFEDLHEALKQMEDVILSYNKQFREGYGMVSKSHFHKLIAGAAEGLFDELGKEVNQFVEGTGKIIKNTINSVIGKGETDEIIKKVFGGTDRETYQQKFTELVRRQKNLGRLFFNFDNLKERITSAIKTRQMIDGLKFSAKRQKSLLEGYEKINAKTIAYYKDKIMHKIGTERFRVVDTTSIPSNYYDKIFMQILLSSKKFGKIGEDTGGVNVNRLKTATYTYDDFDDWVKPVGAVARGPNIKNLNFGKLPRYFVYDINMITNNNYNVYVAFASSIKTALEYAEYHNKTDSREYSDARYKSQIDLLETAEAIDLYYRAFTDILTSKPRDIKGIFEDLETKVTINQWRADNIEAIVAEFATITSKDGLADQIFKFFQHQAALKIIISLFVKIGEDIGGEKALNATFKSPNQIYESLVNYVAYNPFGGDKVEDLELDNLFKNILHSIYGKIFFALDVHKMSIAPTYYANKGISLSRMIMGGADAKIKAEALEIYFRVVLLLEFFKDILTPPTADAELNILMVPAARGNFARLFRIIFAGGADKNYSTQEINEIIEDCNMLYVKFGSVDEILREIVFEVNSRIGIFSNNKITEALKSFTNSSLNYNLADLQSGDYGRTDLDLFSNYEDKVESAPSDEYTSMTKTLRTQNKLITLYENNVGEIITRLIDKIKTKMLLAREIELTPMIRAKKTEFEESSEEKKFAVVESLINNHGVIYSDYKVLSAYIIHELVYNPVNVCLAVNDIAEKFNAKMLASSAVGNTTLYADFDGKVIRDSKDYTVLDYDFNGELAGILASVKTDGNAYTLKGAMDGDWDGALGTRFYGFAIDKNHTEFETNKEGIKTFRDKVTAARVKFVYDFLQKYPDGKEFLRLLEYANKKIEGSTLEGMIGDSVKVQPGHQDFLMKTFNYKNGGKTGGAVPDIKYAFFGLMIPDAIIPISMRDIVVNRRKVLHDKLNVQDLSLHYAADVIRSLYRRLGATTGHAMTDMGTTLGRINALNVDVHRYIKALNDFFFSEDYEKIPFDRTLWDSIDISSLNNGVGAGTRYYTTYHYLHHFILKDDYETDTKISKNILPIEGLGKNAEILVGDLGFVSVDELNPMVLAFYHLEILTRTTIAAAGVNPHAVGGTTGRIFDAATTYLSTVPEKEFKKLYEWYGALPVAVATDSNTMSTLLYGGVGFVAINVQNFGIYLDYCIDIINSQINSYEIFFRVSDFAVKILNNFKFNDLTLITDPKYFIKIDSMLNSIYGFLENKYRTIKDVKIEDSSANLDFDLIRKKAFDENTINLQFKQIFKFMQGCAVATSRVMLQHPLPAGLGAVAGGLINTLSLNTAPIAGNLADLPGNKIFNNLTQADTYSGTLMLKIYLSLLLTIISKYTKFMKTLKDIFTNIAEANFGGATPILRAGNKNTIVDAIQTNINGLNTLTAAFIEKGKLSDTYTLDEARTMTETLFFQMRNALAAKLLTIFTPTVANTVTDAGAKTAAALLIHDAVVEFYKSLGVYANSRTAALDDTTGAGKVAVFSNPTIPVKFKLNSNDLFYEGARGITNPANGQKVASTIFGAVGTRKVRAARTATRVSANIKFKNILDFLIIILSWKYFVESDKSPFYGNLFFNEKSFKILELNEKDNSYINAIRADGSFIAVYNAAGYGITIATAITAGDEFSTIASAFKTRIDTPVPTNAPTVRWIGTVLPEKFIAAMCTVYTRSVFVTMLLDISSNQPISNKQILINSGFVDNLSKLNMRDYRVEVSENLKKALLEEDSKGIQEKINKDKWGNNIIIDGVNMKFRRSVGNAPPAVPVGGAGGSPVNSLVPAISGLITMGKEKNKALIDLIDEKVTVAARIFVELHVKDRDFIDDKELKNYCDQQIKLLKAKYGSNDFVKAQNAALFKRMIREFLKLKVMARGDVKKAIDEFSKETRLNKVLNLEKKYAEKLTEYIQTENTMDLAVSMLLPPTTTDPNNQLNKKTGALIKKYVIDAIGADYAEIILTNSKKIYPSMFPQFVGANELKEINKYDLDKIDEIANMLESAEEIFTKEISLSDFKKILEKLATKNEVPVVFDQLFKLKEGAGSLDISILPEPKTGDPIGDIWKFLDGCGDLVKYSLEGTSKLISLNYSQLETTSVDIAAIAIDLFKKMEIIFSEKFNAGAAVSPATVFDAKIKKILDNYGKTDNIFRDLHNQIKTIFTDKVHTGGAKIYTGYFYTKLEDEFRKITKDMINHLCEKRYDASGSPSSSKMMYYYYYQKLIDPLLLGPLNSDISMRQSRYISTDIFRALTRTSLLMNDAKPGIRKFVVDSWGDLEKFMKENFKTYIPFYKSLYNILLRKTEYYRQWCVAFENDSDKENRYQGLITMCEKVIKNFEEIQKDIGDSPIALNIYPGFFEDNPKNLKPMSTLSAITRGKLDCCNYPVLDDQRRLMYGFRPVLENIKIGKSSYPGIYDLSRIYNSVVSEGGRQLPPINETTIISLYERYIMLIRYLFSSNIKLGVSDLVNPLPDIPFSKKLSEVFQYIESRNVGEKTRDVAKATNLLDPIGANVRDALRVANLLDRNIVPINLRAIYRSTALSFVSLFSTNYDQMKKMVNFQQAALDTKSNASLIPAANGTTIAATFANNITKNITDNLLLLRNVILDTATFGDKEIGSMPEFLSIMTDNQSYKNNLKSRTKQKGRVLTDIPTANVDSNVAADGATAYNPFTM